MKIQVKLFATLKDRAGYRHLENLGTKPRVYYLNVPKRFIGGLVYDPAEKEIVEGARCTLVDAETGAKLLAQTDGFGDFWFKDLKEGSFSLTIEAPGFVPLTYAALDTSDDINLGEIALGR